MKVRLKENRLNIGSMRLIEKNIWSLFVLSAVVGLFSSCDKDMSYPVYLQVDSALVTTNYPTQGTASSYVSDVWVTVNGKNMGTYEIPAIIPVIASGPANVQLEAGIKMNGVAVKRPYYPFYTADVRQMQLESKKTYTLTPSFTYEPRTIFEFKEDFEDDKKCAGLVNILDDCLQNINKWKFLETLN